MRGLCARLLLALICGPACQDGLENTCQVERVAAPLVGGFESGEYLGISESEARAVVALELDHTAEIRDLCSAVVVGADTVFTAAHCFALEVQTIHVGNQFWSLNGGPEFTADLLPELDVALVRLPGLDTTKRLPLSFEDAALLADALVEIAGAGVSEDGSSGRVDFAVAKVTAVSDRYLGVKMASGGGPCGGDSGGPLLLRDAHGRVAVGGILSQGAPDCNGPDQYVRVDILRSWFAAHLKEEPALPTGCGDITADGRCFGRRAVWCDAGNLSARYCDGGQMCGWSEQSRGYRCVLPLLDPCAGIADTGQCVDGAAVRCAAGQLERLTCGDCNGTCETSARTGKAFCAVH